MSTATLSYFTRAFGLFEPSISISADGHLLAYASFSDASRHGSIFLRDTIAGTTRILSSVLADSENYSPALSSNGSTLAFTTVAPGWPGSEQIAVTDLASGAIGYASTNAAGVAANGDSRFASVSGNGRYIAFDSAATNLVSGDTNGVDDVFVKDMQTGAVRRVSISAGGSELWSGGNGALISDDGNVVLFRSLGPVLPGVAGFASPQLYAKNLATGSVTLVSANGAGQAVDAVDDSAAMSADGRYVVFSSASNLAGDTNGNYDIFRKDLVTGTLQLVSSNSASVQGNGWASDPSVSADGRFVSFTYDAADLVGGARSSIEQVYVKDMQSGALTQVSQGSAIGQDAIASVFSGDGSHLSYVSYAGLAGLNFDVSWDVVMASLSGAPATIAAASTAAAPTQSSSLAVQAGGGPLVSSSGNDNMTGSAKLDTAIYHGKAADYDIRASGASFLVSDRGAGRDGADSLTGIERLQFTDGMIALDTMGAGAIAGQAYRIYQAAFNRSPDSGGLGYWIDAMDKGQSLTSVATGFAQSAEFASLYGANASNAHIVDTLYLNVLHRPGEAAGIAYWTNVLDQGHGNVASVLASFSESAENVAALVGVLEHGVVYTPFG